MTVRPIADTSWSAPATVLQAASSEPTPVNDRGLRPVELIARYQPDTVKAADKTEGDTVQETDMSATERLVALMDHLGLDTAYFGTPIPRDISGLATAHPERLA